MTRAEARRFLRFAFFFGEGAEAGGIVMPFHCHALIVCITYNLQLLSHRNDTSREPLIARLPRRGEYTLKAWLGQNEIVWFWKCKFHLCFCCWHLNSTWGCIASRGRSLSSAIFKIYTLECWYNYVIHRVLATFTQRRTYSANLLKSRREVWQERKQF